MRYIVSILLAIILIQMNFYVLANMNNAEYSFGTATIIGIIVGIFVILLGEFTTSEEEA